MYSVYEAQPNHAEVCIKQIRAGLQDENVLTPNASEVTLDDFFYTKLINSYDKAQKCSGKNGFYKILALQLHPDKLDDSLPVYAKWLATIDAVDREKFKGIPFKQLTVFAKPKKWVLFDISDDFFPRHAHTSTNQFLMDTYEKLDLDRKRYIEPLSFFLGLATNRLYQLFYMTLSLSYLPMAGLIRFFSVLNTALILAINHEHLQSQWSNLNDDAHIQKQIKDSLLPEYPFIKDYAHEEVDEFLKKRCLMMTLSIKINELDITFDEKKQVCFESILKKFLELKEIEPVVFSKLEKLSYQEIRAQLVQKNIISHDDINGCDFDYFATLLVMFRNSSNLSLKIYAQCFIAPMGADVFSITARLLQILLSPILMLLQLGYFLISSALYLVEELAVFGFYSGINALLLLGNIPLYLTEGFFNVLSSVKNRAAEANLPPRLLG
jgi:hypothetical protein